jgi:hypothetical protein
MLAKFVRGLLTEDRATALALVANNSTHCDWLFVDAMERCRKVRPSAKSLGKSGIRKYSRCVEWSPTFRLKHNHVSSNWEILRHPDANPNGTVNDSQPETQQQLRSWAWSEIYRSRCFEHNDPFSNLNTYKYSIMYLGATMRSYIVSLRCTEGSAGELSQGATVSRLPTCFVQLLSGHELLV